MQFEPGPSILFCLLIAITLSKIKYYYYLLSNVFRNACERYCDFILFFFAEGRGGGYLRISGFVIQLTESPHNSVFMILFLFGGIQPDFIIIKLLSSFLKEYVNSIIRFFVINGDIPKTLKIGSSPFRPFLTKCDTHTKTII